MSFFKNYHELSDSDLPDPNELSLDDKCILCRQLVSIGESKAAISRYFGKSRPTIYAWLKRANDERLSELENKTFQDKYIDRLNELEIKRDYYAREVEKIRKIGDEGELDPVSGEMIVNTSHYKIMAEMARLVRDYEKAIIDLEIIVGVIPKNDPGQLFNSISDYNPELETDKENLLEMEDEEVSMMLLNKLRQKQTKLGDTILKKVKDEKII